jgi:hypothetical protein
VGFTYDFHHLNHNYGFVPNTSEGFNCWADGGATGFIQLTLLNYEGIVEIKYGTGGNPL